MEFDLLVYFVGFLEVGLGYIFYNMVNKMVIILNSVDFYFRGRVWFNFVLYV